MKTLILSLPVVLSGFFAANLVFAQTWTVTDAPNIYCKRIASSADGTKLLLTTADPHAPDGFLYSGIFISTNAGSTWTQTSAPTNEGWLGVTSSTDGAKMVAVSGYEGSIYTSTDSGATWVQTCAPKTNWFSVASSADGGNVVAGVVEENRYAGPGPIFFSTNSGRTWTQSVVPDRNWYGIASSADGTKLVAAGDCGAINSPSGIGWIYASTNSGATWTQTSAPSNNWISVASSADGSKLAAAFGEDFQNNLTTGQIYISTNSGDTWFKANVTSENWSSIVSSADGVKLAALADPSGRIYLSTNSGAAWTLATIPRVSWETAASSADGNRLAVVFSGGLTAAAYSSPSPSLEFTATNGILAISWIIPSTNFVLQQSADLSGWTDLTNQPALNLTNLQDEVFLPLSGSGGFYRLKTP